jgi:hypothetical protein
LRNHLSAATEKPDWQKAAEQSVKRCLSAHPLNIETFRLRNPFQAIFQCSAKRRRGGIFTRFVHCLF